MTDTPEVNTIGQVNAAVASTLSPEEIERKKIADFANLVQELVYATETEDRKLMVWYANELRQKYQAAITYGA